LRYKIELDEILGDAGGNYDDFDPDEDFIWAISPEWTNKPITGLNVWANC
jgi:hypothetical protein